MVVRKPLWEDLYPVHAACMAGRLDVVRRWSASPLSSRPVFGPVAACSIVCCATGSSTGEAGSCRSGRPQHRLHLPSYYLARSLQFARSERYNRLMWVLTVRVCGCAGQVNLKDGDTWTPAHYACYYGQSDVLRELLLQVPGPSRRPNGSTCSACRPMCHRTHRGL